MDTNVPTPEIPTAVPPKSGTGKIVAWVVGAVVALLLILGVTLLLTSKSRKGLPLEAKYLSENTNVIGYLNVSQVRSSSFVRTIMGSLSKNSEVAMTPEQILDEKVGTELVKTFGLRLDQVSEFTVFGSSGLVQDESLIVLKASAPVSHTDIVDNLKPATFTPVEKNQIQIFQATTPEKPSFAIFERQTVLFGGIKWLNTAQTNTEVPKFAPNTLQNINEMDFGHSGGIALDFATLKESPQIAMVQQLSAMLDPGFPAALEGVNGMVVITDIDSNIGATLSFLCKDEAASQKVEEVANGLIKKFAEKATKKTSQIQAALFSAALSKVSREGTTTRVKLGTHANPLLGIFSRLGSAFRFGS